MPHVQMVNMPMQQYPAQMMGMQPSQMMPHIMAQQPYMQPSQMVQSQQVGQMHGMPQMPMGGYQMMGQQPIAAQTSSHFQLARRDNMQNGNESDSDSDSDESGMIFVQNDII